MKVKLTKGELKRQRDALKRYERFLPTLQLKKQQLQMEILHQVMFLEEQKRIYEKKISSIKSWCGLFTGSEIKIKDFITAGKVLTAEKNIAGVDIPIYQQTEFAIFEYDLFATPVWLDAAIDIFKEAYSLQEEIRTIEKGISILRYELRVASQRVNLFEKVKIPESQEAIRLIKIYIGDQMSNAVGRSKIAKKKIEEGELLLAGV